MNLRDFRIGWRLLAQEPVYSIAVILSLAIGFASCFLLTGFVRYSFSYDSDVPQADRVFLVKSRVNTHEHPRWSEATPLALLGAARESGMTSGASAVVPLTMGMRNGALVQSIDLAAVNPDFPAIVGVKLIAGDLRAALTRPDALALTASSAARLFGNADDGAIGKTLHIGGKPYTVAALIGDRPGNSTLTYGALAGIDTPIWPEMERKVLLPSWGYVNGAKIYVRLKPGVAPATLEHHLQRARDQAPSMRSPEELQRLGERKAVDIRLGALSGMYFDADTANTPFSSEHGNARSMFGLTAIALLILALAAINYTNLATVRALRRQREIAVRKVLGATGKRLLAQFLAESLTVAMAATLLGLVLAWVTLPLFAELVARKLDGLFTPTALLCYLGAGAAIGLLSGAYPAWVALRVRPPQALAGRGNSETAGALWLRRVLTVLQFSTAMGLVAVTLAVAWQTSFASQADPGFDPKPLLVLELPVGQDQPAARNLRAALARLPGVEGVAAAGDPIGASTLGAHIKVSRNTGQWSSVTLRTVSANYFDVHHLRPIAGRLLSEKTEHDDSGFDAIVINERTAMALGFATPQEAIGQIISTGNGDDVTSGPVVGVVPELRHASLRDSGQSYLYFASRQANTLTLRASGDPALLEGAVQQLATQYFPDEVIPLRQARSYFTMNYAEDLRLAKLLGLASLIAIVIAGFGVYVLSAYSLRRLARQIVLRKLFGADGMAIARLVGREFLMLIGVGAAIGLPLAAVANQNYLASFVEHAPIGAWPLLAGLLVAVLVTLAATGRSTIAAMRMSPSKILKD